MPRSLHCSAPSRLELAFTRHVLNRGGLVLLFAGLVVLLKAGLSDGGDWTAGVLATVAGTATGLSLLLWGESCHQRGYDEYASPLAAGGLALLSVTVCASHFYYALIGHLTLFVAMSAIVTASGVAMQRYAAQSIGPLILVLCFGAPMLLHFSLAELPAVFAYLLAVSLGVAVVAARRQSDLYLIGAFGGTYAVFFQQHGLHQPAMAMLFLALVYGLFLYANHAASFTGYNVVLSYVNPVVFAVVSYSVLLSLPSIVALSVFLAVAGVHLLLMRWALAHGFQDVAVNNLVLGLLFATAAVSFLIWLSWSFACYSIVALLWFAEGILLSGLRSRFRPVMTGASVLCMGLASAQLYLVVPTLCDRGGLDVLQLVAALLYWGWFQSMIRSWEGARWEGLVLQSAVVASGSTIAWLLVKNHAHPVPLAALTGLALVAARRYPQVLGWLPGAAVVLSLGAAWLSPTAAAGTAAWALCGVLLLYGDNEWLPRVVLFLAFMKSVVFDTVSVSLGVESVWGHGAWASVLVMGLAFAAWRWRQDPEAGPFMLLLTLLSFAFHASFELFLSFGRLLIFQVVLSGFWAATAFGCIVVGLHGRIPVFRLFGLVLLVGTVAKQMLVDLAILNAYSQTSLLLGMGAMLLAVSWLYQRPEVPQLTVPPYP